MHVRVSPSCISTVAIRGLVGSCIQSPSTSIESGVGIIGFSVSSISYSPGATSPGWLDPGGQSGSQGIKGIRPPGL